MEFNVKHLFELQNELDQSIYVAHQTDEIETLKKRILAFIVEVAELANETRCFKFWSHKKPSSTDIILEEYADGLHFLISVGITLKIDTNMSFDCFSFEHDMVMVDQFLVVFDALATLAKETNEEVYCHVFTEYIRLGMLLGFDGTEIEAGYLKKNKINHERQASNY